MNAQPFLISFLLALTVSTLSSDCYCEENNAAKISEKPIARISFINKSGLIVVPVKINGSRTLDMILDSGMSSPVVVLFHSETGEEIGLTYQNKVALAGAGSGEQKSANMATGATVTLSDIEMTNQTIIVFEESRETSSWSWDGIIGKSLFDRFIAEIDYENSAVTLYDPSSFKRPATGIAIPIDLKYGFPVIETDVIIENDKKIHVRLVIDLGHRSTLFLKGNDKNSISMPSVTIDGIAGRGIQGEVPAKIGRIKELQLNQFILHNIPTSFLPPDAHFGINTSIADGDIGSHILSRFKVIFDYPQKQLFLVPNKHFDAPFEFNMAGLIIEQDSDGNAVVRYVIKDSPAAKADIRKNDKIVSINGKDIRKYTNDEINALFTQAGKDIRITIERDAKQIPLTLKLKQLL